MSTTCTTLIKGAYARRTANDPIFIDAIEVWFETPGLAASPY